MSFVMCCSCGLIDVGWLMLFAVCCVRIAVRCLLLVCVVVCYCLLLCDACGLLSFHVVCGCR